MHACIYSLATHTINHLLLPHAPRCAGAAAVRAAAVRIICIARASWCVSVCCARVENMLPLLLTEIPGMRGAACSFDSTRSER